ncbi:MAG: hypothetical protein JJT89_01200 [Nitriliruptoraceae bacterium]|nr:hypothetical protein [Nitriliruptoraceae bacterium]
MAGPKWLRPELVVLVSGVEATPTGTGGGQPGQFEDDGTVKFAQNTEGAGNSCEAGEGEPCPGKDPNLVVIGGS